MSDIVHLCEEVINIDEILYNIIIHMNIEFLYKIHKRDYDTLLKLYYMFNSTEVITNIIRVLNNSTPLLCDKHNIKLHNNINIRSINRFFDLYDRQYLFNSNLSSQYIMERFVYNFNDYDMLEQLCVNKRLDIVEDYMNKNILWLSHNHIVSIIYGMYWDIDKCYEYTQKYRDKYQTGIDSRVLTGVCKYGRDLKETPHLSNKFSVGNCFIIRNLETIIGYARWNMLPYVSHLLYLIKTPLDVCFIRCKNIHLLKNRDLINLENLKDLIPDIVVNSISNKNLTRDMIVRECLMSGSRELLEYYEVKVHEINHKMFSGGFDISIEVAEFLYEIGYDISQFNYLIDFIKVLYDNNDYYNRLQVLIDDINANPFIATNNISKLMLLKKLGFNIDYNKHLRCLIQRNDYLPSELKYFISENIDKLHLIHEYKDQILSYINKNQDNDMLQWFDKLISNN